MPLTIENSPVKVYSAQLRARVITDHDQRITRLKWRRQVAYARDVLYRDRGALQSLMQALTRYYMDIAVVLTHNRHSMESIDAQCGG